MTDNKTVEVDADKLSDEVIEDLVDEGRIDESEAKEIGDKIWLGEVDVADPNKKGTREFLSEWYNSLASTVRNSFRALFGGEKRTAHAVISSVGRSSGNDIRLHLEYLDRTTRKLSFDAESKVLANLMEYHNADDPTDLEGCRVLLSSDESHLVKLRICTPHNVSGVGKLRFRLYSMFREIYERSEIRRVTNDPDKYFELTGSITILTGFVGVLGSYIGSPLNNLISALILLPFAVSLFAFLSLVMYGIHRVVLLILLAILDSDFKEV